MSSNPTPAEAPATALSPRVREFLQAPRYAVLATSGEDGEPHQATTWFRLEPDDRILLNSRWPRRWPRELSTGGRCSIAVVDPSDREHWVGLQGVLDERVDDLERARQDICDLADRYDQGTSERYEIFRAQPRVSFLIRVTRVHDHLDD